MLFGWQGKRQLDKPPVELARRCTRGTLLLIHPIAGKGYLLGNSREKRAEKEPGRNSPGSPHLPAYRFVGVTSSQHVLSFVQQPLILFSLLRSISLLRAPCAGGCRGSRLVF